MDRPGKQLREDFAKLFKPHSHLTYLFFVGIANQEEILRTQREPIVFCENGGVLWSQGEKKKQQGYEDDTGPLHTKNPSA